jgi:hypothetical protein
VWATANNPPAEATQTASSGFDARGWRNPPNINFLMGMGNNNLAKIKFVANSDFGGVVGPSQNTDSHRITASFRAA